MGHMKWPPKLLRRDILGEVIDTNGRPFRRDIGRPVYLGGNTYYSFGDTFCHSRGGQFHGVQDSTLGYVPHPRDRPTECYYIHNHDLIEPFITHTQSEIDYLHHPENKRANNRIGCGCFGGIVEDRDDCGTGWCFLNKSVWHGAQPGKHFGVGVARVSLNPDKSVRLDRVMGDNMLFGLNDQDPRFGSMATLVDDDGWVYLFGEYDPEPASLDKRCHLARIRRDADFTQRSNYQYFVKAADGKGTWADRFNHVNDLKGMGGLNTQLQGGIIKVPEFAPAGKPYMWFGVNKFGVGHMYVSCAPAVTGPWEEVADLGKLPDIPQAWDGNCAGMKYCLYPNPRASNLATGEMICTWTDAAQLGGKIIAARFWFEGNYERAPPPPPPGALAEHTQHGHKEGTGLGGMLKGKLERMLNK